MRKIWLTLILALSFAGVGVPSSAQAGYWTYRCHHIWHPCHYGCYHHPAAEVFAAWGTHYDPPYYYYAPYSYVNHVLVHRSLEIGPEVATTTIPSLILIIH